ncbi:hypothetical protein QTP88_017765 [Uroleucon formosanum]
MFFKAGFTNEIIETDIEIPDVQREWELLHCDGVTLQDYLKIDEDIAIYESPTEENIVEEVRKKENPDKFEEEDEEEHAVEQSKLTEEDILNTLSVVRNGFRQEANVPDEIFLKLDDIETFYEKITIFKNYSKQNSLIISFKLHLKLISGQFKIYTLSRDRDSIKTYKKIGKTWAYGNHNLEDRFPINVWENKMMNLGRTITLYFLPNLGTPMCRLTVINVTVLN